MKSGKPKELPRSKLSSNEAARRVAEQTMKPDFYGRHHRLANRDISSFAAFASHTKGLGYMSRTGKRSNRSSRKLRDCKQQHHARMAQRRAQG